MFKFWFKANNYLKICEQRWFSSEQRWKRNFSELKISAEQRWVSLKEIWFSAELSWPRYFWRFRKKNFDGFRVTVFGSFFSKFSEVTRQVKTVKLRVDIGTHKWLPQYQLIPFTDDEFEPKQQHTSDAKTISVTWEKKPPSTSATVEQKIAEKKPTLPQRPQNISPREANSDNKATCFK